MPHRNFSIKIERKPKHYDKIKDSIDLTVSIIQAATMLDEAGEEAIRTGDTSAMLGVAAGWIQLGATLLGEQPEGQGEEEHEVLTDTSVMGFASQQAREEMEDAKKESKRKIGL
jgi:hypothetical protein